MSEKRDVAEVLNEAMDTFMAELPVEQRVEKLRKLAAALLDHAEACLVWEEGDGDERSPEFVLANVLNILILAACRPWFETPGGIALPHTVADLGAYTLLRCLVNALAKERLDVEMSRRIIDAARRYAEQQFEMAQKPTPEMLEKAREIREKAELLLSEAQGSA